MVMHAFCDGVMFSVASYGRLQNIHEKLLIAIKEYIEMEGTDWYGNEKMVDLLVSVLSNRNGIDRYKMFDLLQCREFSMYDLDGIFPFLQIDEMGVMSAWQSKKFLKTYHLIEDYVDDCVKSNNRTFEIEEIFKFSVENDEDIHFS